MRRGRFVRSQVLRREILQGVLSVEAVVCIAPGVLEGSDGLSGNSGAMVHFYPAHPARAIPHPHELEHTLARLPILTKYLQEIGPTQHEQRGRLQSSHRGVAWSVGVQGRFAKEGAGI